MPIGELRGTDGYVSNGRDEFEPFSDTDRTTPPEIGPVVAHLREVLGDQIYESLARKGESMTAAAMATYAYDQIEQARAELKDNARRAGHSLRMRIASIFSFPT